MEFYHKENIIKLLIVIWRDKGLNMKRLVLIGFLVLFSASAFSQEKDSRAPFQGIWYDVDDAEILFVFIDDIFFINGGSDGGGSFRYSVEDNNLILTNPRKLDIDGWEVIHEGPATVKTQYVFSGDRLTLIFDGEPIILSRIPEW
jgi:hypothetical protein